MLSLKASRRIDMAIRLWEGGTVNRSFTIEEIIAILREQTTAENLPEILQRLPRGLADALQDSMSRYPALLGVGYWYSPPWLRIPRNDRFPDPTLLVDPAWRTQERQQIVAYLETGWEYMDWRGLSYCRFHCGIDEAKMGSHCITDGEWVWPEGLAHYVAYHHVRLPDEFIASMQRGDWKVPTGKSEPNWFTSSEPDYSFWIAWGQQAGASHEDRDSAI